MPEQRLEQIVASGMCTGCGACVAAVGEDKLQMRLDASGFLRPVATRALDADQQRRIRAVCPGIGLEHPRQFEPGTRYDVLWGPSRRLAAGHATDAELRFKASSGGVLSALLLHLLDSGAVDFVVQTRADRDDPLLSEAVFSRSRQDILEAAGSRYAPASPVAALPRALTLPGRIAFVGKPCDVAAVRRLIAADPALAARIPYLLSFMCAGTPSQAGTLDILKRVQIKPEQVVEFRYRGEGWPGLTRAATAEGRVGTLDYNTAWGQILNRQLQPRCKLCADGTGEFADVVCADAWYGKDGYPDFAERAGRSLLLARSERGTDLVNAAVAAGHIAVDDFDVSELRGIQPYQFKRKTEILARCAAARVALRAVPRYSRLALGRAAWQIGPLQNLRAFGGALARILRGRLT